MSRPGGLGPLYCSEEVVVLSGSSLAAQGWEQRTVTDPTRIAELKDLYTSLGFETKTSRLHPASFGEACNSCAQTACATYLALFVRKADPGLTSPQD